MILTVDDMRSLLHTSPFRPFVLHLVDGKSMRVPHPDWLIAGRGQAVVVDDSGRGQIGDLNIVPYESISRIELLEPLV